MVRAYQQVSYLSYVAGGNIVKLIMKFTIDEILKLEWDDRKRWVLYIWKRQYPKDIILRESDLMLT